MTIGSLATITGFEIGVAKIEEVCHAERLFGELDYRFRISPLTSPLTSNSVASN
ncbi:MAG TPA: hypothetical protein VGG17_06995 [Acidimicrobiales bacterium]